MNIVESFPFFSIMLTLIGGVVLSVLNAKWAKRVCIVVITGVLVLSSVTLAYTLNTGESFIYMMGHFSAPWGNVIKVGILEAVIATFFSLIMLLCVLGGAKHAEKDIEPKKLNLYYLMLSLLLASILALTYTDDMFTAYVFVELNTLAACGMIVIRQKGHTIVAGIRYMIMSIMGSGLFLIGICLLYDITGQLSMSSISKEIQTIAATGEYSLPLEMIIGLICVGLAMKSALFPFHFWVPDTYGYSTCTTASILSSLVSKSYIFLLIKFIFRVVGFDTIINTNVNNALFVLGIIGMIAGSLGAIKEKDIRRMVAYSSVAQIGYIYMGLGTGTVEGVVAAIFHIFVHASAKSLLFISSAGLTQVSGESKKFRDLTGAGFRNKPAGLAFSVGALSMVGIPSFAGFMSKILFATTAINSGMFSWIMLITIAISTVLNAVYFLKTLLRIFTNDDSQISVRGGKMDKSPRYIFSLFALVFVNLFIGLNSGPLIDTIESGLRLFS